MNKFSELAQNLRDAQDMSPPSPPPQLVTPPLADLVLDAQNVAAISPTKLIADTEAPAEIKSKKRIDRVGLKYTAIIKDLHDGVGPEIVLKKALDLITDLYGDKTASCMFRELIESRNNNQQLF